METGNMSGLLTETDGSTFELQPLTTSQEWDIMRNVFGLHEVEYDSDDDLLVLLDENEDIQDFVHSENSVDLTEEEEENSFEEQVGGGGAVGNSQQEPEQQEENRAENPIFTLDLVSRTEAPRFRAINSVYAFQFVQTFLDSVRSADNPDGRLTAGFDALVTRLQATENLHGTDTVTFYIEHPNLKTPVCIPFVRVDRLTGSLIMTALEHVAQSCTTFTFDSKMIIKINIVRNPNVVGRGNGRLTNKKVLTVAEFARRKALNGGSITKINNSDALCLGRAIVTSLYFVQHPKPGKHATAEQRACYNRQRRSFTSDAYSIQTRATEALYDRAGLPREGCIEGRPAWDAFQACLSNEAILHVHTMASGKGPSLLYAGYTPRKDLPCIDIFWWSPDIVQGVQAGHYDAINAVEGLYGNNKFCRKCYRGYRSDSTHGCSTKYVCTKCHREGGKCFFKFSEHRQRERHDGQNPAVAVDGSLTDFGRSCQECRVWFPTGDCYAAHLANRVCQFRRWCQSCHCEKKVDHECLKDNRQRVCNRCKSLLGPSHRCHMTVDVVKEEDKIDFGKIKYVFYDFESMTDENGKHIPNLCVLQLGCGKCFGHESEYLCQTCPWRSELRTGCVPADFKREIVISGPHTTTLVGQFFSRLAIPKATRPSAQGHDIVLADVADCDDDDDVAREESSDEHVQQSDNVANTCSIVAVAHYAKGYDNHIVLKALLEHLIVKPKIVMVGGKILDMAVGRLFFRDSHNYIPTALKNFSKTFDLNDGEKGFFPHLFNTVGRNQTAVLDELPSLHFYDPDGMFKHDRATFMEWYEVNRHRSFNMQTELLKYCRQDVEILRRGCASFIDTFLSLNGVNPFYECLTLPQACMLTFRRKYLRPNTVAIIPPNGYEDNQPRRSRIGDEWLASIERAKDITLDREVSFTCDHVVTNFEKPCKFKVDGYNRDTKEVYELLGCFWHGCRACFPRKRSVNVHYGSGTTLADRYDRTMYRLSALSEHPDVSAIHAVWECRYRAGRNAETDLLPDEARVPLRPRDAFYGGRTNGIQLHKKCGEGEKIRYADICSLYPYVCKRGRFPISHPRLIHNPSLDRLYELDGLIKCEILPPRRLYHPLLPYRVNGRLYFPLCRTCAAENAQTECQHTDDERTWVGTYTTLEVQKAVRELGYAVKRIFSAWHFSQFERYEPDIVNDDNIFAIDDDGVPLLTGQGLFAGYVDNFYKLKQESSGYPPECTTEDSRAWFVEDVFEKERVSLEPSKIKHNPGKRAIAKFMLNSHWGKLGQSNDKTQCLYITEERTFFDLYYDACTVLHDCIIVNQDTLLVTYSPIEEHQVPHASSNPVIAAWVTAQARLKLYEALEVLGDKCLYFDTDSVLFVEKEGEPMPLKLGDSLGEWTDEIEEGNWIDEFVTCGAKNYAYRLHHPPRKGPQKICKIRGFTLNYRTSSILNFEALVKTALQSPDAREPLHTQHPNQLKRAGLKRGLGVHTVSQPKQYRFCYVKRRIIRHPDTGRLTYTVPYGYDTLQNNDTAPPPEAREML